MRIASILVAFLAGTPATAQVIPEPGIPDPRIQTARWVAGQQIDLTAMPGTPLTLVFEAGEQVGKVTADSSAIETRVSEAGDSVVLFPLREGDLGFVQVATDRRSYTFSLRTGTGLMAGYLVRMGSTQPGPTMPMPGPSMLPPAGYGPPTTAAAPVQTWTYRLRGDRSVRPSAIGDDGQRTTILFSEDSALPAIFAIGPTGEEQVVNGYMRGEAFVIDRVWQELVFRIDGEKASARRNEKPEERTGG
ncbi:MAG: TrbG/VirB9 family P-type conjugative transfer protein [Erythrobacter sp.]|nr:TrbG/VirB9 family P-type conjugative transfer protein [Erythrobacter sp.]